MFGKAGWRFKSFGLEDGSLDLGDIGRRHPFQGCFCCFQPSWNSRWPSLASN